MGVKYNEKDMVITINSKILEKVLPNQRKFVYYHEIAHIKFNHIEKTNRYGFYGFLVTWGLTMIGGLTLGIFTKNLKLRYIPILFFAPFLGEKIVKNISSYRYEIEADNFAAQSFEGGSSAGRDLFKHFNETFKDQINNRVYEFLINALHPSTKSRIRRMDSLIEK